jgi:hypothetical protein
MLSLQQVSANRLSGGAGMIFEEIINKRLLLFGIASRT